MSRIIKNLKFAKSNSLLYYNFKKVETNNENLSENQADLKRTRCEAYDEITIKEEEVVDMNNPIGGQEVLRNCDENLQNDPKRRKSVVTKQETPAECFSVTFKPRPMPKPLSTKTEQAESVEEEVTVIENQPTNPEIIQLDSDSDEEIQEAPKCLRCGRLFRYVRSLNVHRLRKCSKFTKKQCLKCFAIFNNSKEETAHKCLEKTIECPHCEKTFSQQLHLKQHIKIHIDKEKKKCKICSKKFVAARLERHILNVHKSQPQFECDLCERVFRTKNRIMVHMPTHLRYRPMICKVCNKGFIEKRYFEEHKLNHEKKNPFECAQCGSGYSRKTSLNRHMKTAHSDERPFKCDECKYRGKTKDDLTTHKKSHTKAFSCDKCNRKFSRSSLLKEHRILHDNPDAYSCKICKVKHTQKKSLKLHLALHAQMSVKFDKRRLTDKKYEPRELSDDSE